MACHHAFQSGRASGLASHTRLSLTCLRSSSLLVPSLQCKALSRRGRSQGRVLMALQSEAGQVELITSEEDFAGALAAAHVVVVDWMAKWCRKCIYIKPKLQKLFDEEFPQVPLHFVDVNSVPGSLVTTNGIRKMPTISVYKDGKKVSEHVASETGTAALPKVREMLQLALL